MSDGVPRIKEGYFEPIAWTEFQAWQKTFGHIVLPEEFAILRAMDAAYRSERNTAQSAYRERLKDAEEQTSRKHRGRRR